MDDGKMLQQAADCVASCLDVHGTQAETEQQLEALIAVATSKLQKIKDSECTEARREYLRATTTDPHLLGLIDAVDVTCCKCERLGCEVYESQTITLNRCHHISAFYVGGTDGCWSARGADFAGIAGINPAMQWLMLFHLRSCLGLNEAISLGALATFLNGAIGKMGSVASISYDGIECIDLPDYIDKKVVAIRLDEATANTPCRAARPSSRKTTKRDRSNTVMYQCPLQELERLLLVAAATSEGAPLFQPEDTVTIQFKRPWYDCDESRYPLNLEAVPSLLSTPLATMFLGQEASKCRILTTTPRASMAHCVA